MPAPGTVTDFLTLVRQSGLLAPRALDGYLARLGPAAPPPDRPEALAGCMVRDGLLTHFQAEQLLRGKNRGFLLGRYRILEQLGAGGMGAVYLAEHVQMARRVALKVLPPDQAAEPLKVA